MWVDWDGMGLGWDGMDLRVVVGIEHLTVLIRQRIEAEDGNEKGKRKGE